MYECARKTHRLLYRRIKNCTTCTWCSFLLIAVGAQHGERNLPVNKVDQRTHTEGAEHGSDANKCRDIRRGAPAKKEQRTPRMGISWSVPRIKD